MPLSRMTPPGASTSDRLACGNDPRRVLAQLAHRAGLHAVSHPGCAQHRHSLSSGAGRVGNPAASRAVGAASSRRAPATRRRRSAATASGAVSPSPRAGSSAAGPWAAADTTRCPDVPAAVKGVRCRSLASRAAGARDASGDARPIGYGAGRKGRGPGRTLRRRDSLMFADRNRMERCPSS